jgi:hypothetical protein
MQNHHFAVRYQRRAKELLTDEGLLGEASVVQVWDSLYNTISTALYDEAARWGDYRRDVHQWQSRGDLYTVDNHYMKERNRLLTQYFPIRSENVLNSILTTFDIIDDEPDETGIASVSRNHPTDDNHLYNLNGQQVKQPSKGIYIIHGKKIIIK